MKIRFTQHSILQCKERGTNEKEILDAIEKGESENVKNGRIMYRSNFQYNREWGGKFYKIKQVAPVVKKEDNELIVITIYTFYF